MKTTMILATTAILGVTTATSAFAANGIHPAFGAGAGAGRPAIGMRAPAFHAGPAIRTVPAFHPSPMKTGSIGSAQRLVNPNLVGKGRFETIHLPVTPPPGGKVASGILPDKQQLLDTFHNFQIDRPKQKLPIGSCPHWKPGCPGFGFGFGGPIVIPGPGPVVVGQAPQVIRYGGAPVTQVVEAPVTQVVAAPAPAPIPLVCKAGGSMTAELAGETQLTVKFTPGATAANVMPPQPGECTWPDRAFGTNEPPILLSTLAANTASLVDAVKTGGAFLAYVDNDTRELVVKSVIPR